MRETQDLDLEPVTTTLYDTYGPQHTLQVEIPSKRTLLRGPLSRTTTSTTARGSKDNRGHACMHHLRTTYVSALLFRRARTQYKYEVRSTPRTSS
jgi:hypothetical protein